MPTLGTTVHPELGGEIPFRVDSLPEDADGQVEQTIRLMCVYSLASADTPELQRDLTAAAQINPANIVDGIHRFVHSRLRFRQDEDTAAQLQGIPNSDTTIEVLVPPVDLSRAIAAGLQPAEDCDGFSMYVAALLTAAGIPCRFVTVAADPTEPTHYSHVYVAAYPDAERTSVDASHGDYAGWECPNRHGKRREWPVKGGTVHTFLMVGLIAAAAVFANYRSIAA